MNFVASLFYLFKSFFFGFFYLRTPAKSFTKCTFQLFVKRKSKLKFHFLFVALCSIDVARDSREMMDNFIENLSINPDQTVQMVQEYVNGSNSETVTGTKGFVSSVYAIKNGRKTMEDRHIMIHDLNKALNLQVNLLTLVSLYLT